MIDKRTGHIIISDTIQIRHHDTKNDVLSLNIGQTNKQWNHGNGWSWLQENNAFVDNKYFIFQFGFFEDKLKVISFCLGDTKFDLGKGWEDWSEEKELVKLEKYKTWLASELGSLKNFEWGTVWASYDSKIGGTSIDLKYRDT